MKTFIFTVLAMVLGLIAALALVPTLSSQIYEQLTEGET